MKLYRARKGTPAKLIINEPNKDVVVKDWTIRRDVQLGDPIIDPVRYHNRPSDFPSDSLAVKLALQGYGIYYEHNDPNHERALYLIAIPYDRVEVLA